MKKFISAVFATLGLLVAVGGGLVAQENIAVWKFPQNVTDVTCVSSSIQASDCAFSTEGTAAVTGTNNSNTVLCDETDNTKSLQISGQAGGSAIFKISTLPFVNIGVTYDIRSHPSMTGGYSDYAWSYSFNGVDFVDAPESTAITGFESTTFVTQTADFSSIADLNGVSEVWFKLTMSGAESASYASNLDNVVFTGSISNCYVPADLIVSGVTRYSATLSWAHGGGDDAVSYSVFITSDPDEEPIDETTVTETENSFTGLTPGTTYYVYVKTNCSETISSAWVSTSFTTCYAPSGLTVANVTGTSAEISWTDTVNSQWQVCVTSTSSVDWAAAAIVDAASYVATGLSLNTPYTVYVRPYCTDCDCATGTTGTTVNTTFRTAFAEQTAEIVIGTGTSASYNTPMCNFYGNSWVQMIYDVAEIGQAGTIGAVSWNVSSSSSYSVNSLNIYMGVTSMNSASSTASWIPMSDLTLVYSATNTTIGSATGWETYTLTEPFEYDGSGNLVVVVARASDSYTSSLTYKYTNVTNSVLYRRADGNASYAQHPGTNTGIQSSNLPNMKILIGDPTDICLPVVDLDVSDVSESDATIVWNAGSSETAWVVKYGVSGFDVELDGTELQAADTSAVLTGLTPATEYDVYVKAVCAADDESGWNMFSFYTECSAIDLPYAIDFESYEATSYSTAGVMPMCWDYVYAGSASYAPHVSTSGTIEGNGLLVNATATNSAILIMPEFSGNLNEAIVKFDTKFASATYGILSFGYYLDDTFTAFQQLNSSTSITSNTIDLSNESDIPEGARLAFEYTSTNTYESSYYVNIDNVYVLRPASCGYVSEASVVSVTNSTATIEWETVGDATQWQVQFNGEYVDVDENTYLITGLNGSTAYTVSIRTSCGSDEYSDYIDVSFTTSCDPITVDSANQYDENFDATEEFSIPECWTVYSSYQTGTYVYPCVYNSTSYAHSGTNSLRMYTYYYYGAPENIIAMPPMSDINTLQVSFWASFYSTKPQAFEVGYIKAGVFTAVESITTLTTVHQQYTVYLNSVPSDAEAIAFRTNHSSNSSYVNIDDVNVTSLPSCVAPYHVSLDDISYNSATVTWVDVVEASAWQYQLGEGEIVDVTAKPIVLTDLSSNTDYTLNVRTSCSEGEYTDWSTISFSTLCEPLSIVEGETYSENFDSYTTTSSSTTAPSDYPNHAMPDCWTFANMSESTSSYPQIFLSTNSSYIVSGNCLFFKSSSSTPAYAVMPAFTNNIEDMVLSFSYRNEGTSEYNGTLHVGISDDIANLEESYIDVKTYAKTTTITQETLSFADETTETGLYYIVFKYVGGSSNNYYMAIEDVSLRITSSDNAILSYSASTEQGEAICTLDNEAHTISAIIRFGYTAGNAITPTIELSSSEASIQQLVGTEYVNLPESLTWYMTSADTTITYKVIAENGDEQEYVATYTIEACPSPDNLVSEQTSLTNVDFSWTSVEGTSAWNFYCSTEQMSASELDASAYTTLDATSTSYTVEPETTYYWYVRSACDIDNSAWLSSSFTTWEECIAPQNITTEIVADGEIQISWDVQDNLPVSEINIEDSFERTDLNGGTIEYTNGTTPWSIVTSGAYSGSNCLVSSSGHNSATSQISMTTSYDIPVAFSFWYKVSTESGFDKFFFEIDGTSVINGVSGTIAWTQYSTTLEPGNHTLAWKYTKDGSVASGSDCVWIDDLSINASVSGANSSVVLYRDDTEIATLPATESSYVDTDLTVGTYCYSIKTICREGNESALSDQVCAEINSCYAVTNLVATDIEATAASVTWTRGSDETAWNIKISGNIVAVDENTDGVSVDGDDITYAIAGLEPMTAYTVEVLPVCAGTEGQTWVSVEFVTLRVPAELPYICDFEDENVNNGWVLENGTQTNQWYIGTAANNGGENGLYISNNNGVSNAYTITNSTYVYAYREINFVSASEYNVSFDWKAYGESSYDYIRVFLVPNTVTLTAGSANSIGTTGTPAGWISLDGASKLNLSSSWQTLANVVSVETAGLYNLVFYWKNDGSSGSQPPAAIDNVSITEVSCPAVGDIAASEITNVSAIVTWVERGPAESWDVVVSTSVMTDEQLESATPVETTTTTYNMTDLTASTSYHVYIRANCAEDDLSRWADLTVTTVADCPAPSDLVVAVIEPESITVEWEGYHATQWTLEYKLASAIDWTVIENVTAESYTIDAEPATSYMFRVKAACENDVETAYSSTLNVTTPCHAIADFPWTEDFESVTTPNLPECWTYENVNNDGDYWKTFTNSSNKEAGLYTDFNSGNNDDYLILPSFELDGNYVFSYDVRVQSTGEPNDYEVLLSTTGPSAEDFTVVLQSLETVSSTTYSRRTIRLEDYHGTVYIAMHVPQGGLDGYYIYMDNFELREMSSEAEILTYTLPTQLSDANINSEAALVNVTVSYSTDMSALEPALTVSEGATFEADEPVAGDAFTTTIDYEVTSEDGQNVKQWTAIILRSAVPSAEKDILTFSFASQVGESVIDADAHTVSAVASWNTNLAAITPTITVSPMATISPASATSQDFTTPFVYTVTAEDETTQEWTVTIVNDPTACPNPSAIEAEVYANSAVLQWEQAYIETSYLLKVSSTAMTDMTAEADVFDGTVAATQYEITGLEENNTYYVYLQSDCDNAEGWVSTTFYTGMCIPAPTSVDSDGITNVTFGTTSVVNNNTHPSSSPYYGDYTDQVGDVQASTDATVSITLSTGYTYGVVVWVNWNNDVIFSDDEIVYRTETSSTSPTTVEAVFVIPADIAVGNYRMRIGAADSQFNDVTSPSPCLNTSYTIYEDYTLQVTEAPSCLPVTDLAVSGLSEDATITWVSDASSWDVVWSTTPLDDPEVETIDVVESPSYELSGLTPSTTYYVYVRARCSDDEYSAWKNLSFTTDCGLSTLPFIETFDATSASRQCWTIADANSDNYTWGYTTDYYHSQEVAAYSYNSYDNANDWLISPLLAITDGASLVFDYWCTSSYPETFSVYVMNNTTDYANATVIRAAQTVSNESVATIDSIDLSDYAGQEIYIAIKCESAADMNVLYIDNFKVLVPSYIITASAGENGTITPSGEVEVYSGMSQSFSIVPETGYRIASVLVDDVEAVADVVDGVYTFTNVTADHTIVASFEERPVYTITATSGANGTITPSGEVSVYDGDSQSFTLAPSEGFELTSLLVDDVEAIGQIVDGVYTFTNVAANHTIYAIFNEIVQVTYDIIATNGPNGSITPAGNVSVLEGHNQTFTLIPEEGYHIASLTVDGEDAMIDIIDMTYTFYSVNANHTIDVTFTDSDAVDEYTAGSLSIYPNPNNGMFSIDFSGVEGDATYQLIDARGAIIETTEISVVNGETMDFNHNLRPGTYFVRIISGDKVYVEQIVVE